MTTRRYRRENKPYSLKVKLSLHVIVSIYQSTSNDPDLFSQNHANPIELLPSSIDENLPLAPTRKSHYPIYLANQFYLRRLSCGTKNFCARAERISQLALSCALNVYKIQPMGTKYHGRPETENDEKPIQLSHSPFIPYQPK